MSTTNVVNLENSSHQTQENEAKSIAVIPDQSHSLLQKVKHLQQKFNSISDNVQSPERFPVNYHFSRVVSASRLLQPKFSFSFSPASYEKSRREMYAVILGLTIFMFVSFITWAALRETNYTTEGNFIYNMGLIGGILMLLTFLYSAIKRIPKLKRWISSDGSYYFHIACGATGGFLIIIHSSFDFGSINSSVALISMIVIMISGALGRYLYTQCTTSLHRAYIEIKESEPQLFNKISTYDCKSAKRVRKRLSRYALRSFRRPTHVLDFLTRSFSIIYFGAYFYIKSLRDLYKIIYSVSILSDLDRHDVKNIKKTHRIELRRYIFKIIKMGYISLLERLFHHWRILHIPMLFLLLVTAVIHVVVVHMY